MTAPTPFGAYAPSQRLRLARSIAGHLPKGGGARLMASLLRTLSGARAARSFDVEVFGLRARLYPADNLADKRAILTPHWWDAEERAFLAQAIKSGNGLFRFADVGANSGLYTLYAKSVAAAAGRPFAAVCIEADAAMAERLAFNLSASAIEAETRIVRAAASARAGTLRMAVDPARRGSSRIDDAGDIAVAASPLADLLGGERFDALKIDIEGGEKDALGVYFAATPEALRPGIILAELAHDTDGALQRLIEGAGYRLALRTRLNGAFTRHLQ
jgi:FkbM family methyltransferase